MGLSIAKLYNDKLGLPVVSSDAIGVIYNDEVYSLENTLNLPEPPLSLIYLKGKNPSIVLTYDAEDRVVFSLKGNRLHFIVLTSGQAHGKKESISYPWLSNLDGIRVSRMSEDEYKDFKYYNLMEFRD